MTPLFAEYAGVPGLGYHTIDWLEKSTGVAPTFYGQLLANYGKSSGIVAWAWM